MPILHVAQTFALLHPVGVRSSLHYHLFTFMSIPQVFEGSLHLSEHH